MKRKPVDIIIPIYNAYDDLVQCMRSIRRHTDLSEDRVILIDDCSTDKKIFPFLECQKEKNIVVIYNKENRGFSNNVNTGMLYSDDRDVILLNSDTIVTERWVDKIVRCAYSKEEIATVTPLSNSATLCSVPVICKDNSMPDNLTVDEMGALVERCSLHRYPRITVAVGFCMFIKRKAIQEVGLFDAETFERGYGEENDFCNRAELLGYIHAMCDDTFIYHKGTVSFMTEQKAALIEAHDRILQERYPEQMRINHLYCATNPDQYIRDNINFYLRLKNGRKNILYVVQSDFREDAEDHVGGTQLHVRDLTMSICHQYNVFVMARNGQYMDVSLYNDVCQKKILSFYIGFRRELPAFYQTLFRGIFYNVFVALQIDVVHVHHVRTLTLDVYRVAKELGIPLYATLHDFYMICPNEKLLYNGMEFCGVCKDFEKCRECLANTRKIAKTVTWEQKWRDECGKVLSYCENIFVPSESTKEIYCVAYPELRENIVVIGHGYQLEETKEIVVGEVKVDQRVHVSWDYVLDNPADPQALVGWACMEGTDSEKSTVFIEVEGKHHQKKYIQTNPVLREDVAQVLHNDRYRFCGFHESMHRQLYETGKLKLRVIIGVNGHWYTDGTVIKVDNYVKKRNDRRLNVAFLGGLVPEKGSRIAYEMIISEREEINWYTIGAMNDDRLLNLEQENFCNVGRYNRNEVAELLKAYDIDVVCVLSIWPETFCYTISEALLTGIPILTNEMGAMGERMRNETMGWVLPKGATARDYVEKLRYISEHPECLREKKEEVGLYMHKSLREMADEYCKYYAQSGKQRNGNTFKAEFIYNAMIAF